MFYNKNYLILRVFFLNNLVSYENAQNRHVYKSDNSSTVLYFSVTTTKETKNK